MHYVCGCLFYQCGGVFCTACLLRPCWEKIIGSSKLGWVVVILSVGRGICGGWVVELFLWLLEFQQGIKDFVGGYDRIVI